MTGVRHTWLFKPGIWVANGSFWEGGRARHEGRGRSVVCHTDSAWEIDGEMEVLGDSPVRFRNRYRIAPPRAPGAPIAWRSENPALGRFEGIFAVADETILSFVQTADRTHCGGETLTRLAADRYRACGLLVSSGQVASTWSMELVRQA